MLTVTLKWAFFHSHLWRLTLFLSDFNKNFRAASYWSKMNSTFLFCFIILRIKVSVFKFSSELLTVQDFLKFFNLFLYWLDPKISCWNFLDILNRFKVINKRSFLLLTVYKKCQKKFNFFFTFQTKNVVNCVLYKINLFCFFDPESLDNSSQLKNLIAVEKKITVQCMAKNVL